MITNVLGRKRSFYRQLLFSYLRIAIVSAIFCVILLTFVFLLSANTGEMNESSVPQSRSLHQMSKDIEKTKSALRSWVLFGEDRYKDERRKVWEEIQLQLGELELRSSIAEEEEQLRNFTDLRQKLADLNQWQWQIEDIAHSPENLPAHWLWKRDGLPTLSKLRQAVESLLLNNQQRYQFDTPRLPRENSVLLVKVNHLLSELRSEMEHYLSAGESTAEAHLQGYFARLDEQMVLLGQQTWPDSEQPAITWLLREFNAFKGLSKKVVNLRYSDEWNMLQFWTGKHHLPIERDLNLLIQTIDEHHQRNLASTMEKADKLSNRAIFIATLMPITMFLLIYYLANRNATGLSNSILALSKKANDMARGHMSGSINIGGTLELDALATAFNRMQNSLKDSYGRLHGVVDTALDAIITINNQGRIESFNKSAEAMFGYSANDMIGQSINMLMADNDARQHDQHMRRYLRSGRSNIIGVSREVVAKRRDGSVFPISISVSEMKLSNYHGFTGIIRDLTQDKKRTEQLIEAEKMSALGLMVAGVAHEVNNPLGNAITANSFIFEQLKNVRKSFTDGKLRAKELEDYLERTNDTLEIINGNLYRAAEIVSNFKNVAMDQSSGERRRINLHQYLGEVLHTLYPRYKRTDIDVSYDCPRDVIVFTYPGAIFQIISNLVVNSIVHGFKDNKVGNILIRVTDSDTLYTVDYTDSGEGVSAEVADHIFEPFVTTRKEEGGSGLGMHIVQNIVEQKLLGEISLLQDTDVGIHIRIILPKNLILDADQQHERSIEDAISS